MQLTDFLVISNIALTLGVLALAYTTWKLDNDVSRIDWWQKENMKAMGAMASMLRSPKTPAKRKPVAKTSKPKAKTTRTKKSSSTAKKPAKKPATKRGSSKAKKPRKKANANPTVGTNGQIRVH